MRDLRRLGGQPDAVPWIVIVLSLIAIAGVGTWNTFRYPVSLSYDAVSTANYMQVVLKYHRIPTPQESAESRQPPVYYVVGGLAAHAGHRWFGWREASRLELAETSYRGAQILNVLFVLATALLLLLLARAAAPDRPAVWAAALAFFAFLPVVAKTEAMIHPEPLNMLLSTLALWLTVKVVRAPSLSKRLLVLLLVVLAVGLATRASILFTAAAIAVGLVVRYARYFSLRRLARQLWVIALAGLLLTALVLWVASGGAHSGLLASLGHPLTLRVGNRSGFFSTPIEALFTTPFRPHFLNSAFGETYTEIWGDWIGAFAWSDYGGPPGGTALSVLKNQNWIGVLPSLLALGGYVLLVVRTIRDRRHLLAVTLVPPLAITGYLIRSYEQISPDGDLFKASYILTTAPVWAICFGLAFAELGRFRLVRLGIGAALVVFAVLELRFMLYGVRDGNAPF